MQLPVPLVGNPHAPLARANPVAKLGAAAIFLVSLVVSLDGVTALVILAVLLLLLPFSGLDLRALAWRARLVGLAALSIGLFNVLFAGEQLGSTVIDVGPLRVG